MSTPLSPPLRARTATAQVLAAALYAACLAWPGAIHAQGDADSASPASAHDEHNADQRSDDLPTATRRARADEERLYGSPSTSSDPYKGGGAYTSDGASPAGQEKALTSEQRMQIVSPSEFYSASGTAANKPGNVTSTPRRHVIRPVTSNKETAAKGGGSSNDPAADYDYGASATSPTAKVYGNPYTSPNKTAAQLYRSPW